MTEPDPETRWIAAGLGLLLGYAVGEAAAEQSSLAAIVASVFTGLAAIDILGRVIGFRGFTRVGPWEAGLVTFGVTGFLAWWWVLAATPALSLDHF